MYKSRASRRRHTKNLAIGVAALAFFLATLGGVAYYLYTRDPGLERQTLCPKSGPIAHTILLVDKTDPLNFSQKQAFLRLLEELVDRRIAPGELVSVFVLGEDFREGATPLVEICNPGSGAGRSELTANVAKLDAQYRERFRDPLLRQADALISTRPAKSSPLIEMLQLVSINGFRKHEVQGTRRLIIVSDMLHKTPQYSMYQGTPDFDAYASTEYARKMRSELGGVQVELHRVLNDPKLQTPLQLAFWEAFFSRSGARIVTVRPMEG